MMKTAKDPIARNGKESMECSIDAAWNELYNKMSQSHTIGMV